LIERLGNGRLAAVKIPYYFAPNSVGRRLVIYR
jgi:hypothetical protein